MLVDLTLSRRNTKFQLKVSIPAALAMWLIANPDQAERLFHSAASLLG